MLVFFVLLTVIVQIGFLIVARTAAGVALEAAVRNSSVSTEGLHAIEARLVRDLTATVPGADDADIALRFDDSTVIGTVSFDWTPPGPDLIPVRVSITRRAPIAVPP
jgi:hypothetical protein